MEAQEMNRDNQPLDSAEMSIEDAFARLQEILGRMEEEGITLEESFAGYEEGMKLLKYCNEKIDRVEKQVRKMNAEGQLEDFE